MGSKQGKQTGSKQSQHPTIAVEDFGPIGKGEVELRPLTVFAGPSNTGKSWLATLIYAIGRCESTLHYDVMSVIDPLGKSGTYFPEDPAAWIDSIEKGKPINFTVEEKRFLNSVREHQTSTFKSEIERCFSLSELKFLARRGAKKSASISANLHKGRTFLDSKYALSIGDDFSLSAEIPGKLDASLIVGWDGKPVQKRLLHLLKELSQLRGKASSNRRNGMTREDFEIGLFGYTYDLSNLLFESSVAHTSVWYLPADRGGIMHAHHSVVSALIQGATSAAYRTQQPIPTLSGVLADFLQHLVELAQERPSLKVRGKTADSAPAKALEKNILGGQVNVEKTAVSYPRFSWKPAGWSQSLPLLNVSSMVSELAPVALYLRHFVRKGDLLILEEPEAHLHPAKQVALMREVAGWVHSGIRVILTTHSEWVLEALSNLVAEGENEKQSGKPVSSGLSKDQVGLWQFEDKESKGSHIKEVVWDENEGGFETDFFDVAADLHNRWASLVGGRE